MDTVIVTNCLWAIALVLYYFAGKKLGYAKGYCDGIEDGHKNVLSAFNASSEFLNEVNHDKQ